jgi:hypothetical protein
MLNPFDILNYPWKDIQITLTPLLKGIWWLGIGAWVGGLSERTISSYTSNQSFNATEIGLITIALIMALCWLSFGLLFHSINQSKR